MENSYLIKITLCFCLITLLSCQNEGGGSNYKANAKKNGKNWVSDKNTFVVQGRNMDSLNILFFSTAQNKQKEYIEIKNIPFAIGDYELGSMKEKHRKQTAILTNLDYDIPRC